MSEHKCRYKGLCTVSFYAFLNCMGFDFIHLPDCVTCAVQCKHIEFYIVFVSLVWISSLFLICCRQNFNRTNSPGFQKKVQFGNENTKLELRKVPPELNNISKLNEHFSKFGNLVNLQVGVNKEKTNMLWLIAGSND